MAPTCRLIRVTAFDVTANRVVAEGTARLRCKQRESRTGPGGCAVRGGFPQVPVREMCCVVSRGGRTRGHDDDGSP